MATLEEAIAGTRRGERWASRDGVELDIPEESVFITTKGERLSAYMWGFPLTGWTRVVEMVSCPLCQGKGMVEKGRDYTITHDGTYSFPNTYRT